MTYANCFLLNPHPEPEKAPPLPAYLSSNLKYDVRRMGRFRLGSHQLEVARGRFSIPPVPWGDRTCKRCSAAHLTGLACKVDDEHHMIFDCEALSDVPSEFASLFDNITTVRDFFTINNDVSVLPFISQCMEIVDESI